MVILAGVADEQIWDIAFECFTCKRLSASPSLPAATALPTVYVLVPKVRYCFIGTVYMGRSGMAGEAARDRGNRETGGRGSTFGSPSGFTKHNEVSSTLLHSYLDELKSLLDDTYDKLSLSDSRARKSPTPPKDRHGLMGVVERLEAAIESFDKPKPCS